MDMKEMALKRHFEWKGKIGIEVKIDVDSSEALSIAYTPGVAEPCMAIAKNPDLSFDLTGRGNFVAVITDGTAVLGLGNIGPEAGMPVMEGKCALFKAFGNVDAFPLCLKTSDTEEIIKTIKYLEGSFGGINLEDISAPRCFEIERRLKEELDIPVFHDDQHGTAIVVGAALTNALKLVKKEMDAVRVVINGAGAAGTAIGKFLLEMGVRDIIICDKDGILREGDSYDNKIHEELSKITNRSLVQGGLADALEGADVFIGASVGNIVTKNMVASMNSGAIILALANPVPEILPGDALAAGAVVVGSGSSQYPNQINNVLVFPGLFQGALKVRAKDINMDMMTAAARAIAAQVSPDQLKPNYIIPLATSKEVHHAVAQAVAVAAVASGVARN